MLKISKDSREGLAELIYISGLVCAALVTAGSVLGCMGLAVLQPKIFLRLLFTISGLGALMFFLGIPQWLESRVPKTTVTRYLDKYIHLSED